MAMTITFSNLEDGQEILIPHEVTGNVVSNAGNVVLVMGQIDDQELRNTDTIPDLPVQNVEFEFNITEGDCPTSGVFCLLTIYAWDAAGAVSTQTRTFKRID